MIKLLTFEEFSEKLTVDEASALDITHLSLDILGLVPGWGEAADLANAVLYIKHKDYLLAALSLISIIPVIGDALGKSTKFSLYLAKYPKAGTTFSRIVDIAKISSKQIRKIKLTLSAYNALIDRLLDEIEKSNDKDSEKIKPHIPKIKKALRDGVRTA